MILNFEAEIGGKLYDCDAGVTPGKDGVNVVELLEVRLVGENGTSFAVVQHERLPYEVLTELKTRASDERQEQVEEQVETME